MATIGCSSRLRFNKLRHKFRSGKHYVGCESGYIEIGAEGWEALKLLRQGMTIAQAEKALAKKFGKCDVLSFSRTLASNGFVESVGGKKVPAPKPGMIELTPASSALVKILSQLLFSRVAYLAYAIMLVLAAVIVRSNPGYVLGHGDFIFTDSLALFLPLSFAITWLLVLLHEFSHYIAGVSLGANPKFGLTHRLFYTVAVTELDSLYEIEPRFRDRAYLAGIVADLLVISWAIIVIDANPLNMFAAGSTLFRLLHFVVLVEVLGLVWQFLFFLRTDLYYYFENMLGIENLHPQGMSLLGGLWNSLRALSLPHERWFRSVLSHKSVAFYAITFVFGVALNTAVFMLFEFPITIELAARALSGLASGLSSGDFALLADSSAFLLISGFNFALLAAAIVATRDYRADAAHLLHYGKLMLQPIHAVMKLSGK